MTAGSSVDLKSWRSLYDLAGLLGKLKPWDLVQETDLVGVGMPDGEIAFVSVMGAMGEHLAIAIYPDIHALSLLWTLIENPSVEPELLLEIPQIQLSFDDRQFIEPEDHKIIKQLGLRFRGRNAWPRFRSYRPGFAPWFIDAHEAETVRVALEQLLAMFRPDALPPGMTVPDELDSYPVRRRSGDGKQWTTEFQTVTPVKLPPIHVLMQKHLIQRWKALPEVSNELEAGFFVLPARIGERTERPAFGYTLVCVESASGAIVYQEMLIVESSMNDMLASLPARLVQHFIDSGVRPVNFVVLPGRFEAILRGVAELLGLRIETKVKLRHLEKVRRSMAEFLSS